MDSSSYMKTAQALNFLALKKEGKINKMKAIKLIYLADRLHLRKYGRPIVGDMYWAMKYGPVGSCAKSIAELDAPDPAVSYAKKYIKPLDAKKHYIGSVRAVDLGVFSQTDIECLEAVYKEFADKDQFELADITHEYQEWRKHKAELDGGKKRVKMNYDDFFSVAKKEDALFAQNKTDLKLAKDLFDESQEISDFFAR